MNEPFLHIPDALLDDLLSALRRHDADDTARLLERWTTTRRDPIDQLYDDYWDDWEMYSRHLDDELSAWVHREATLHAAAGRFEYALCLVERYRRPLKRQDLQERQQ